MLLERVEKLRQDYEGKRVRLVSERPELARFAGSEGWVKTINCNGRALVQFDGKDRSWYDIPLDELKVVEKADAAPAGTAAAETGKAEAPSDQRETEQQLSPLEIARKQKRSEQSKDNEPQQPEPTGR